MIDAPTFEEFCSAIEAESARLGLVLLDALDEPVPTCPGWTGRDLADHMAGVLSFWAHQLATGDAAARHDPPENGPEGGDDPLEWLDAATAVLVETLAELGPDEPCWNWSARDHHSSWVARRMALELAVHRYDGERAAGCPTPIPAPLAVDGIDERLEIHLRTDLPEVPTATLGGSLCLVCLDVDAAFHVEVHGGRLTCRHHAGPASAVLRGPASELFLFTWNRIGSGDLELTGSPAVVEAWASLPV